MRRLMALLRRLAGSTPKPEHREVDLRLERQRNELRMLRIDAQIEAAEGRRQ